MVKLKFPNGVGKNYTFGYEDPNFYRKNAGHLSDIFVEKPIPMAEFLTFDDMTFNLCESEFYCNFNTSFSKFNFQLWSRIQIF